MTQSAIALVGHIPFVYIENYFPYPDKPNQRGSAAKFNDFGLQVYHKTMELIFESMLEPERSGIHHAMDHINMLSSIMLFINTRL